MMKTVSVRVRQTTRPRLSSAGVAEEAGPCDSAGKSDEASWFGQILQRKHYCHRCRQDSMPLRTGNGPPPGTLPGMPSFW
jgi:hypothetical protein